MYGIGTTTVYDLKARMENSSSILKLTIKFLAKQKNIRNSKFPMLDNDLGGGDPSWVMIGQVEGMGHSILLIGSCVSVGEKFLLQSHMYSS